MSVSDALKRKIGREAVDWVYLGVRTGMRRAVDDYRLRVAKGQAELAIELLKRAVDLPNRARDRLEAFSASEATKGQDAKLLDDCLALAGTVTWQQIDSDLATLEAYADSLVQRVTKEGLSWDQVADDIEANVAHEAVEWKFTIPAQRKDVWQKAADAEVRVGRVR